MIRIALILSLLLAAAAIATYVRYQSLDPCVWMEKDLAEQTGMPLAIVRARIAGGFLLEGITDPSTGECLLEWWGIRRNEAIEGAE